MDQHGNIIDKIFPINHMTEAEAEAYAEQLRAGPENAGKTFVVVPSDGTR